MKSYNRTRLWTFQPEIRLQQLLREGFLVGNWAQAITDNRETVYRYMASEMAVRGVHCGDNPPMWAWHSCGGYQHPPDHDVARSLLSDYEIENLNIMLLSLECPSDRMLPSDYFAWCDLFYSSLDVVDVGYEMLSEVEKKSKLFDIDYSALNETSLIQATLPVIKKEYLLKVQQVVMDSDGGVMIKN